MKIRMGFVSNSSSESFTCEVCHNTAAGYDMGLTEAEMFECQNGHVFCEHHEINKSGDDDSTLGKLKRLMEFHTPKGFIKALEADSFEMVDGAYEDMLGDLRYEYPPIHCPICQFDDLNDSDLIRYVDIKHGMKRVSLLNEIKSSFNTYEEFEKYLKENS